MSDYNSSLPIRTENLGDVAVKIVDGTITSQQLSIDSSGRVTSKLNDGSGNALASSTTTPAGTEQALIVRSIPSGTQAVSGTVAVTQSGTWSERLQDGAGNAITSQVSGSQRALDVGINVAGVQVDPRSIRALTASDVVTSKLQDGSGNAVSSTSAGAARPLDTILKDASGAVLGSISNPLVVSSSAAPSGTSVDDYNTGAVVAAAATSVHNYTVTAGKTLSLRQIEASASGKMKIEVAIETGVASGVFNTIAVQFNSTSFSNLSIHFEGPKQVAAGVRVRITRTNLDRASMDVYSTIMGQEV